jgi:hypothetical protein
MALRKGCHEAESPRAGKRQEELGSTALAGLSAHDEEVAHNRRCRGTTEKKRRAAQAHNGKERETTLANVTFGSGSCFVRSSLLGISCPAARPAATREPLGADAAIGYAG